MSSSDDRFAASNPSALTVTLTRAEAMHLSALGLVRAALLCAGGAWSIALAQLRARVGGACLAYALAAFTLGVAGVLAAWVPFVFRIG